jgi:DoxX-like family
MSSKATKIVFWVSTTLIFLGEGVMSAATYKSPMAVQGIVGLGYPLYFFTLLTAAKVLGSLALIIPQVPSRVKEWAYAGFGFDFISAFVSLVAVMGFTSVVILPVVAFGVLIVSYVSYHKMMSVRV